MYKSTYCALTFSMAGTLLCGVAFAQQTSTPPTNPPAATTTTPAKPKTSTSTTSTVKKTPAPLVLKTSKEKASYAIGLNIGKGLSESLKKDNVDISNEILLRGMRDALTGNKPLLTDQETQAALMSLQNDLKKHQQELHDAEVATNSKAGADFLAANKAKPGVVTLPSGLQYRIITPGTGPKPTVNDVVECNYKGTLVDGTEFDSSYKRGKAATFPVGQVIKGWTEALQLMPVGSKWQLVLPPSLAYGDKGTNGGPIGPDATLVFEVELMSIQPKAEAKPAAGEAVPAAPQAQPKAESGAPAQAQPQ
jgi:FKBP-type peptidyl-prolyl cis-trans isomerase FklB